MKLAVVLFRLYYIVESGCCIVVVKPTLLEYLYFEVSFYVGFRILDSECSEK